MKNKKEKDFIGSIPKWAWLLLSLLTALVVWYFLSVNPKTGRTFKPLMEVLASAKVMYGRGVLLKDIGSSLISAIGGFACGFLLAVPILSLIHI